MNPVIRAMLAVGGIMLIDPRTITDIIGLALIALAIFAQTAAAKKKKAAAA